MLVVSPGSLIPVEETGPKETSPGGAVLAWRGAMHPRCQPSAVVCMASICLLEFSLWCVVLAVTVDLLMVGSEVRSNPCHHLGVSSLSKDS